MSEVLEQIFEAGVTINKKTDGITDWGTNERYAGLDLKEVTNIALSEHFSYTNRRLAIMARYWIKRCIKAEDEGAKP